MKLQVTACDIDQKFPAKTYTITASDGRTISKDLCEEHAEPFEEWLEEAEVAATPEPVREPETETETETEPEPAPAPAPAKKAPAKKAPAAKATEPRKTTSRRRPKIVTLEQIEASKKG
ncbi:hypothetical protein ACOB87_37880 [Streptomyces sp. YS-B37]|uniref:hypothetical protein n=1 Tax=Streptomyces sp. YS-B37 TaxID=3407669 RepID=UPI003B51061D